MRLLIPFLLLCQMLLGTLAFALWPVEHGQTQGSNCTSPTGHPESLKIGGETYHYLYDERGRVVSRVGKYTEYRMEYAWKHDSPVAVSEIMRDGKNAEFVRRESRFIYDSHHDLVSASNSEGAHVRYRYNANHQMAGMQDVVAETRLGIEYDPKCNQPNRLILNGGASVAITYRDDCEIDKVGENTDPATAMHIASLFNDLLEAAGPAEMDFFR